MGKVMTKAGDKVRRTSRRVTKEMKLQVANETIASLRSDLEWEKDNSNELALRWLSWKLRWMI